MHRRARLAAILAASFGTLFSASIATAQGVGPEGAAPESRGLGQAGAPAPRSALGDCQREAARRGYAVLESSNFRQGRDGWTIDLRVRDARGRVADGYCFVSTAGQVTLAGFDSGVAGTASEGVEFTCASSEGRYQECQLPVDGRVELVKRLSSMPCVEGRSWGRSKDRVWVDQGCRARFQVVRASVAADTLECASDGRYRECALGKGYFALLDRDLSGGRCRQDVTWGSRDGNVWVTDGCRGRFVRKRTQAEAAIPPPAPVVRPTPTPGAAIGPAALAEQSCQQEAQRRGMRLVAMSAAIPLTGGYKVPVSLKLSTGQVTQAMCVYVNATRQVRFEDPDY